MALASSAVLALSLAPALSEGLKKTCPNGGGECLAEGRLESTQRWLTRLRNDIRVLVLHAEMFADQVDYIACCVDVAIDELTFGMVGKRNISCLKSMAHMAALQSAIKELNLAME